MVWVLDQNSSQFSRHVKRVYNFDPVVIKVVEMEDLFSRIMQPSKKQNVVNFYWIVVFQVFVFGDQHN